MLFGGSTFAGITSSRYLSPENTCENAASSTTPTSGRLTVNVPDPRPDLKLPTTARAASSTHSFSFVSPEALQTQQNQSIPNTAYVLSDVFIAANFRCLGILAAPRAAATKRPNNRRRRIRWKTMRLCTPHHRMRRECRPGAHPQTHNCICTSYSTLFWSMVPQYNIHFPNRADRFPGTDIELHDTRKSGTDRFHGDRGRRWRRYHTRLRADCIRTLPQYSIAYRSLDPACDAVFTATAASAAISGRFVCAMKRD